MKKTLEKSFKEAALAVIAAENGIISPNKLVHILSGWINKPGESLLEKLKEALPPESIDLLELLEPEENDLKDEDDAVSVLIESVQRIKEKTNLSIVPSATGENSSSDRLVTDESPGRYVVQGEIARGGAGRVLIALDRHLGREVAMKELLLDLRDARDGEKRLDPHSKSLRNRFLREARVTGQLEHPSIVPVYEIGQHPDGVFYYTMRMVKGRTLSKAIKECRSLSERLELLPHFYNICNAVAYAHSKGVLNRDLKPSNVMIGEFGETVVLDWGLAKVRGQHDAGADKIQSGLRLIMNADVGKTVVGFAIGTPSYMPPEQAEGKVDEIDETSDIYSLGAILYQLLTDKPPYNGKTASEILRKVVISDLTPVSEFEPDAPPELASIAEKALSKEKEKRYQTATELIDELNNYMSGEKVTGHDYSFFELVKKFASRNKAAFVSSILIFFVLVMSTLTVTWYYRREVTAKNNAQLEKTISNFRAAQAFNEKSIRLEFEKRFLSSRIYAAASILYNPANINSPDYDPLYLERFKEALPLLADSSSRFYQRHFHRGAVFEKGLDIDCRITAMSISKDNRIFLAGCDNGEIRVFESSSLKEQLRINTNSRITGIDISKDNASAVFSSASGNISMFEIKTGKIRTFSKVSGGSECAKYSDDNHQALFCGGDGKIWVIRLSSNELKGFAVHKDSVKESHFTDNGKSTISIGFDNSVVKYDLISNSRTGHIAISDEFLTSMKISPDESTALVGTESGSIYSVDITNMSIKETLKNHSGQITSICFSSDSSMFISSDIQRKAVVWDFELNIPLFTIEGHKNSIQKSFFEPSGNYIVTAGLDGFIRFWKLHGRKNSPLFTIEGTQINGAAVTKDYSAFISRSENVDIFNFPDGGHYHFKGGRGPVYTIALSNDGNLGAVAGWNTEISIFNIKSNTRNAVLKGHSNAVTTIKFSNDTKYLLSGGRDGTVRLFSLAGSAQAGIWSCAEGSVKSIDISTDGQYVAVICETEGIHILSTPLLGKIKTIPIENRILNSLAFEPGSRNIVSGSDNGIFITDIENGKSSLLPGHSGLVLKVSLSKDGNYLASSGRDFSTKIWDYKKQFPILTINTEKEQGCLVFTPDSSGLLICDGNKARVWPLDFAELKKDPVELLKEMEKDAAMKLKDYYLEPGI